MNEPKIEIVNVIEPSLPREKIIEVSLQEVGGEPHLFQRSKGTTLWESFTRVRDLLNTAKPTEPRWIPLTERKPEKGGKVVFCKASRLDICAAWPEGWKEETIPDWATHWTPLPDPPEGK